MDSQTNEFSGFHPRLQSLRGLAALMVCIGHALITIEQLQVYDAASVHRWNIAGFVLQLIFQADTAVIFFFVLSGFVLGQSVRAVRSEHPLKTLRAFAIKRFGRLLPLFWLSIFIVFLYLISGWRQTFDIASGWFNQLFPAHPSLALLVQNVIAYDTIINPILWSIQVELVMIPILPALAWLASRTSLKTNCAVIALALFITCLNVLPRSLSYVFCFHLGVLIPNLGTPPELGICSPIAGQS